MAISIIVAVIVPAAIIGWISFTRLGTDIETITNSNIPAVAFVAHLAETGATITGTAPTLAAADNEVERKRAFSFLTEKLKQISSLISETDNRLIDEQMKTQLSAVIDNLSANIRELDENVRRALWYGNQKEELTERLRWSLADFLEEVQPMTDDIRFNIDLLLSPKGLPIKTLNQQVDYEMAKERALFHINADGNLLAGLIGRAAYLPDQDSLNGTEIYVREIEERLAEDIQAIAKIPGALTLRQSLQDILDFADGSKSLFQLRRDELQTIAAGKQLLKRNLELVTRLQDLIGQRVEMENSSVVEAAMTSRLSVRRAKILLVAATSASFLAAIFIVWIYVGRHIVYRLRVLDKDMRTIAQGNLETKVAVSGSDEIGAMAKSLRTFRDTLTQTQNDLIQTGKLALLGQVSAGIAHEINQPITAIRHYARNAVLFLDQDNLEESRTNLNRISQLTERAHQIINRLRLMARAPIKELSAVDLQESIDNVLSMVEQRISKLDVTVQLDIGEDSRTVAAGKVRLEQVILNIINNGLDAMQNESTRVMSISSRDRSGKVELIISDTGHGINEKDIAHVFDPFFTTKDVGEGMGIGLSISYNIIKDFGGTLSCDSIGDDKTSFRIILDRPEAR